MAQRLSYTRNSVERALELHTREGRLTSWTRNGNGYTVGLHRLTSEPTLDLATLREAWVLVAGLASATHADAVRQSRD